MASPHAPIILQKLSPQISTSKNDNNDILLHSSEEIIDSYMYFSCV